MQDITRNNALLLSLIGDYLTFHERDITAEQIESLTACGISEERAYRRLLISHIGVTDRELLDEYFPSLTKKLDPNEYRADPYFQNISFAEKSLGGWRIGKGNYAPYELFVCDDFKLDGEKLVLSLGYFSEPFDYPAVYENSRLWMSVTPNEINTMKKPIAAARGKALTFGLGLGYYAYMCSLKPEISSVTVVERDQSIIRLFKEHILPQFEHAEKIRIVEADAYDFLASLRDGEYDTAFVDIHHDAGDGREVYLRFKERTFTQTRFDFWIEDTIKYYL